MWLAFDLMTATAHAFATGGVGRGYISFRAHAEVFLAGTAAPDRWPFRRYWLLLNLLYLELTRIGPRPVDGYLLCHLVPNAVEQSYGVDAVESLRANAREAGGAP